jgi:outer membrane protein TolC
VAGWSLLGLGCTPWADAWYLDRKDAMLAAGPVSHLDAPAIAKAPPPSQPAQPAPVIQQASAQVPVAPAGHPAQDHPPDPRLVPVDLDAVLHLAEESNLQIAAAREKLHESEIKNQGSLAAWLPQMSVGMAYYRHEGGIQDFTGQLIHSSTGAISPGLDLRSELDLKTATYNKLTQERELWENKGQLSKVSDETLQEAAYTYIDLLTARRTEGVVRELEHYLLDLVKRAEDLASDNKAYTVLVESIRAEINGRRQAMARLHQQGDAASAKLAYLLGLDPCVTLVPMDLTLMPVELVDPCEPIAHVVSRVLARGPGIKEMQGLLGVAQEGLDKASSPMRFLPVVQMNMYEGPFLAGPGASLSTDNRWDLGLQARWNLNDWLTARQRKQIAESQVSQARLRYQDLQAKLTLGVQESREAISAGREQIMQGAEVIKHAAEAYRLSDERMKANVQGSSPTEVAQSIRALEQAHFNYISALSVHNKAQVRLMLLQGPACLRKAPPPPPHKL